MPSTTASNLSYPQEYATDHYRTLVQLYEAIGLYLRSNAQNADLIWTGGGTFAWNSTTGILSWSADIVVYQFETQFETVIRAGQVTLAAGQVAFFELDRSLSANAEKELFVSTTIESSPIVRVDLKLFASNIGGICFLPNGKSLKTGESATVFGAGAVALGGTSTPTAESFTPAASATTVTISTSSPSALMVFRGGQFKEEGATKDWTRSGAILTFATPFTGSENVVVQVWS